MTAQPLEDAVLDDADARAARRAQQQHKRAEREAALGLPPRPNLSQRGARLVPDMRWTIDAACAGVDEIDAHTLTESLNQQDAAEVVGRLCSRCPVREVCLEAGRSSLAWGVWGGYVLVDGWLAPEHPAKPRTGPKRLTAAPDGTSTQVNQDFGA